MRASSVYTAALICLIGCIYVSCETARNLESPDDKYFLKYIGSDGDQTGVDMALAPDGSIYVLGNSNSSSGQQMFVARADQSGQLTWYQQIGGANTEAKDLELLSDGNLLVLGNVTDVATNTKDFTLLSVNSNTGLPTPGVTYGHSAYNEDAVSVSETTDSFIVSGFTDSVKQATNPADAFFVRFYKDFQPYSTAWSTQHGGDTDFDVAVKTVESGSLFYVFGYSNRLETNLNDGVTDNNVFIWILGASGGDPVSDFTVSNSFFAGSSPTNNERLTSVVQIPLGSGGGFLLTGYSSDTQNQIIFSVRIRQDISLVDNNNVGDIFQVDPRMNSSISQISNSKVVGCPAGSGFFVLGTDNTSGSEDMYLKKLNPALTDAWSEQPFYFFGGAGSDLAGGVAEAPDGRILILGTMVLGESTGQTKAVLIKLSPQGKFGE